MIKFGYFFFVLQILLFLRPLNLVEFNPFSM